MAYRVFHHRQVRFSRSRLCCDVHARPAEGAGGAGLVLVPATQMVWKGSLAPGWDRLWEGKQQNQNTFISPTSALVLFSRRARSAVSF